MGRGLTPIAMDTVQADTAKTATGETDTFDLSTSRSVVVWVVVSSIQTVGVFDFALETSPEDVKDNKNFQQQGTPLTITDAKTFAVGVFNRDKDPIGRSGKVTFTLTGGTGQTFKVMIERYE